MTHDYKRNGTTTLFAALNILDGSVDNYATHKHPNVKQWLADHPRWVFHFTPTSASWLNAVEGFFSIIITRRRIRRGVFKSVSDLQDAMHNPSSKNSSASLDLPNESVH
jgi:transposase